MVTTRTVKYRKPSMTDLPYELGRRIFSQMNSTPKPDFTETRKEVDEIKQRIIAERMAQSDKPETAKTQAHSVIPDEDVCKASEELMERNCAIYKKVAQ